MKLVKRLLDAGVSLQQIRKAVGELRRAGIGDLAKITLISDGAKVYLCTSTNSSSSKQNSYLASRLRYFAQRKL